MFQNSLLPLPKPVISRFYFFCVNKAREIRTARKKFADKRQKSRTKKFGLAICITSPVHCLLTSKWEFVLFCVLKIVFSADEYPNAVIFSSTRFTRKLVPINNFFQTISANTGLCIHTNHYRWISVSEMIKHLSNIYTKQTETYKNYKIRDEHQKFDDFSESFHHFGGLFLVDWKFSIKFRSKL